MSESRDVETAVTRIEELIAAVGEADPSLAPACEELVRQLMGLYGAALERALEILGPEAAGRLAEDKLIASLLVLHGLHPVPMEARVAGALERIGRRLGAQLSIAAVEGDRLRVRAEWNEGAAPPPTASAMIERAVSAEAPEIAAIEIEGLPEPAISLVQIAPTASR